MAEAALQAERHVLLVTVGEGLDRRGRLSARCVGRLLCAKRQRREQQEREQDSHSAWVCHHDNQFASYNGHVLPLLDRCKPTSYIDAMDPDEDISSTDAHEVLRCTRGDETRIYNLRVVSDGAELWRITESPGDEPRSVRESHFTGSEEASQFLEEVRRALIAGGWREA